MTEVKTMDQIVVQSMARPRIQTSVAESTHDPGQPRGPRRERGGCVETRAAQEHAADRHRARGRLAGAYALTCVLSSLLFGVKPTDPWTFGAVSLLLAFVTLLAAFIPARRSGCGAAVLMTG